MLRVQHSHLGASARLDLRKIFFLLCPLTISTQYIALELEEYLFSVQISWYI